MKLCIFFHLSASVIKILCVMFVFIFFLYFLCCLKIWKARLAGYEELATLFNSLDNDKSPEFSRYAGLLMKVVSDSNALTQEKGLDCVIAYLENASTAISAR